nr:hypothetical protein [Mycolicibacterium fortuitum]
MVKHVARHHSSELLIVERQFCRIAVDDLDVGPRESSRQVSGQVRVQFDRGEVADVEP